MSPDFILRHAAPVPRYTSYPTANHFGTDVGPAQMRDWLQALPAEASLSLYVHIPYCQSLCWYCGCSTKATRRYAPVAAYLDLLGSEIGTVSALAPSGCRVAHVHFGGGSPDILAPDDIRRLGAVLRRRFSIDAAAEFAVEVDPRGLTQARADAFADIGVNRVSIGVQDFDPAVQEAIGRLHDFAQTSRAVAMFRARGVASVDLDLVHGLPRQTLESLERTLAQVLALGPDRVAMFGYAHLPARLRRQGLIEEADLPGPLERWAQGRLAERTLRQAGFMPRGIDHFARCGDPRARQGLRRNFQGHATDDAQALIGLGASAISRLPQGFAQNATGVEDYAARLATAGLATARGKTLTDDDQARGYLIEQLMCRFEVAFANVASRHGLRAAIQMRQIARAVAADDADGLVLVESHRLRVTPRGRPLVRNICARFDAYLAAAPGARRHAPSV